MKELGLALLGSFSIFGFFATVVYPDLEYTGYSSTHNCTGECYEEYVRINGTVVEQLQAQQAAAAEDPFSSIRGLWAGCAACHGQNGEGMGAFPKLSGQSKEYIVGRLNAYKNKEQVGAMSSTMWAQAGMLSESDIDTIGKFVEETLK
jgi:cytochrome c553|tara:strand:+ start:781 stop:1224 length:444 start_codon:yes stop_codon:yes gene_type:complete